MEFKKVIYEVQDGIAVIKMNCPENMNAMDEQLAGELYGALECAETDPDVKVVVLKGTEKAFSAGGDIRFFYGQVQSGSEINLDPLVRKGDNVIDKMKKMGKLIVTSVCGAAAGAGVSLALGGDFMICEERTKFLLAFVNLGLVPDCGATYLLSKSIGAARTAQLAVTGRPVTAQEAKELGLAYMVVPKEELEETVMNFARQLTAGPLVSYRNIKRQIYEANFAGMRQWLDECEVSTQHECALSEDFKEGVKAFIEKRKPVFSGN